MRAKPILFGYSWIGILNQLLLQWFFIRLEASLDNAKDRRIVALRIIGPILPLTGWWSKYIWLTKQPRKKKK